MKSLKRARHYGEYIVVLFFFHLVRGLPRSAIARISRIVGGMAWLLPMFRSLVLGNLRAVFPEKAESERVRIGRESVVSLIRSLLDFFWFVDRPKELERLVDFPDETRAVINRMVESAGAKGGLFVTPHLGNWELAGLKFRHDSGIPFAVVVRKFPNPYLGRLVNAGRSSEGNRVIYAKGSVREMLKALKDGFFIATLIDQNTRIRDGGVFVNFMGLPVPTSRAPALFARKTDTPIAVGGCVRKGDRYELFAYETAKPLSAYSDDTEIIQELMRVTEEVVRRYPEQYLWFYKRFQHIPRDAAEEVRRRFPPYAVVAPERFYDGSAPKPGR